MGDGVAHGLHQRALYHAEDLRIESNVPAAREEGNALARGLGGISRGALQRDEHETRRQQTQTLGRLAHLEELTIHLLDVVDADRGRRSR